MTQTYKYILSVFIFGHVLCLIVIHNQDSMIYRHLTWVTEYGNFIGFNTTLRFFSPNPYMRLTEYDIYTRTDADELVSHAFRFPKELKNEKSREVHNRKYSAAMLLISRPDFIENIFGPRICMWHPEAESISIYASGLTLDSLEKSQLLGDTRSDIARIDRQHVLDYSCEREVTK